jgi:hypothetical protein
VRVILPEHLRLGTSSWAYEGWRGQVYRQAVFVLANNRAEGNAPSTI